MKKLAIYSCLLLSLTGCFARKDGMHPGYKKINIDRIPNATPKVEPLSKIGNPRSYKVLGKRYYVQGTSHGFHQRGIASWYGYKFHGHQTSNGEYYDMFAMTAAHKTLPIPTYLKVTNLSNGHQVIVKVNDRGPFHGNRIIDLSYAAAKKLQITNKGTGIVELTAINPRKPVHIASIDPVIAKRHTIPKLYLQLGSFKQQTNAGKLQRKIKHLTNTNVSIEPDQRHQFYKVKVGPLASIEQADKLKALFSVANMGDSITTVDE